MAYLTFVVKGPEQTAREQMFLREIVAETIGFTRTDTIFKAREEYFSKVVEWFGNDTIITGYGYPDGTCLIYSRHDE